MTDPKKKNLSEDPMAALLAELNLTEDGGDLFAEPSKNSEDLIELGDISAVTHPVDDLNESLEVEDSDFGLLDLNFGSAKEDAFKIKLAPEPEKVISVSEEIIFADPLSEEDDIKTKIGFEPDLVLASLDEITSDKTVAISRTQLTAASDYGTGDRTVAVAGYSNRSTPASEENIKISVGQSAGGSSSYGGWGSTDSNLVQAENLKMAQSKILELERENEKLRRQNEELVSASDIIRERSDLLTAQVYEYKNDREGLDSSFKNEMALTKSQLNRKDAELQKAQMKIDELDSRLKFDMKKIRIRERELENRLELIRAEKNALVRIKDEQILESRRKMDQLQLEVDSFRQKCVELNRVIETNQDSFKRTTRALRLAMANLELQEENKIPLKKVD